MSIILNIPADVQKSLEDAFGADLSRTALEALAAEGYGTGKLSRHQIQTLLNLPDRWSAEAWLHAHSAHAPITLEDVLENVENILRAREAARSSLMENYDMTRTAFLQILDDQERESFWKLEHCVEMLMRPLKCQADTGPKRDIVEKVSKALSRTLFDQNLRSVKNQIAGLRCACKKLGEVDVFGAFDPADLDGLRDAASISWKAFMRELINIELLNQRVRAVRDLLSNHDWSSSNPAWWAINADYPDEKHFHDKFSNNLDLSAFVSYLIAWCDKQFERIEMLKPKTSLEFFGGDVRKLQEMCRVVRHDILKRKVTSERDTLKDLKMAATPLHVTAHQYFGDSG
jgi:hypothetical protein